MKKSVVISIVALVFLLVIGMSFWKWKNAKNAQISQNNQDWGKKQGQIQEKEKVEIDTGDWKVYKNEEFGLEVKYPSNGWTLSPIGNSSPFKEMHICYDYEYYSGSPQSSCVSIMPVRNKYGENDFFDVMKNSPDKMKEFKFLQVNSVMFIGDDGKNWERYKDLIIDGNGDYCSSYNYIFIRILDYPGNWKTKNEQIGISCMDPEVAPILKKITENIHFSF